MDQTGSFGDVDRATLFQDVEGAGRVGQTLDPARIAGFRQRRPDLKWVAGNLYERLDAAELGKVGVLNLAEYGGDLDQALSMAQKAKAKFPHQLDIAEPRGWIFIKKNLSDNAISIFKELVEKDQKNPIYRYHLAVAFKQKGDKSAAKREAELALKNSPSKEDEQRIRTLLGQL